MRREPSRRSLRSRGALPLPGRARSAGYAAAASSIRPSRWSGTTGVRREPCGRPGCQEDGAGAADAKSGRSGSLVLIDPLKGASMNGARYKRVRGKLRRLGTRKKARVRSGQVVAPPRPDILRSARSTRLGDRSQARTTGGITAVNGASTAGQGQASFTSSTASMTRPTAPSPVRDVATRRREQTRAGSPRRPSSARRQPSETSPPWRARTPRWPRRRLGSRISAASRRSGTPRCLSSFT